MSVWAIFVWVGTGVYAAALSAESIYRQNHFRTGFDTAIADQLLWLAANGHTLFSTIVDRSLLAGHFEPGLLLLTPLYWIGQSALWVVIVAALASALDYFRRFNVVLDPRVADFAAARDHRSDRKAG